MKIGILTFQNAANYGAVFQAKALAETIHRNIKGFECEIIDYQCREINRFYHPLICRGIKDFLKMPIRTWERLVFNRYIYKTLPLSKSVNRKCVSRLNQEYDILITGSDQIWNGNLTGKDDSYLLDFADKSKKISYAASIGSYRIPLEEEKKYRNLWLKYDSLSVREKKCEEEIYRLTGRHVPIHIDPTLLMEREYWINQAVPMKKKKYILIYSFGKPDSLYSGAKKIAEKTGWKIYAIGGMGKPTDSIKHLNGVSPEKWLGLIQNAEVVLTNSFHGTVFSIFYHTPFFVDLVKKESDGKITHNDRIEDLLCRFQLQNQKIENAVKMYKKKIDWKFVDEKLPELRQEAVFYLRNAIEYEQENEK